MKKMLKDTSNIFSRSLQDFSFQSLNKNLNLDLQKIKFLTIFLRFLKIFIRIKILVTK